MKKIFVAMLALAAATACSNDELVSVNQEAIGFDNAFINNSVRSVVDPSLTASTLADFQVYGYVENTPLFNAENIGVTVYKNGGSLTQDQYAGQAKTDWKYEGTQYWIAGAKYNFNAVAPMTNGGWTKTAADATSTTLSFANNGTTDLLYAYATAEGKVSGNAAVAFDFRHVLSKVKFSFENDYNATNATIRVKNIVITNPHKTANVVLGATTVWSDLATDNDFTLAFGMATDDEATTGANENVEVAYAYGKTYESQNELFLIPSSESYPYNVAFTVELLVSNTVVATYTHTATATFAPLPGNAYDIKTVINATNIDPNHAQEPIEFTVNALPDWGTSNNVNAVVPQN